MKNTSNSFILTVQFCKSCSTHNWCTHHDQQKYLNTYQKLKHYLQQQFGRDIFIQGNVIPQQLIPIKPAQNKYYNTKTNKYVTFPSIGSFQVYFQNQLLFSKKKSNTWPNFGDISDKIFYTLNGKQRTKTKKQNNLVAAEQRTKTADVDILTQKDNLSNKNMSFLDHADKRTTFHKHKRQDQKNFTLTDHFKNYHKNYKQQEKRNSQQFFTSNTTDNQNQLSQMSSFRNNNSSEKDFLQFKRNFQQYGLKGSNGQIPDFLKRKAYVKDDFGKKQMIIRLDSIQQESIVVDQLNANQKNNMSFAHNPQLTKTNTTFQSKSKQNHKKLMKKFNQDFQQLQAKFKNFQQKVQNIRLQKKKYDHHNSSMPKINQKMLKQFNQIKKKQRKMRSSQMKDNVSDTQQQANNPIIFARRKLKNVEDYINGTQEQKNQKLKRIYGEWKLLKKPLKIKNYVSPYKIRVSKIQKNGKTQTNNQKTQFSSTSSLTQQCQPRHIQLNEKQNLQKFAQINQLNAKSSNSKSKQRFYQTARGQFNKGQSSKLNNKYNNSFDQKHQNLTQNKFYKALNPGAKINTFNKAIKDRFKNYKLQQQLKQQSYYKNSQQSSQGFVKSSKNGRILKSLEKQKSRDIKKNDLLNSSRTNKHVQSQYLNKNNKFNLDEQQQLRKITNQRNSFQQHQGGVIEPAKKFRSKNKRNIKNQISKSKQKSQQNNYSQDQNHRNNSQNKNNRKIKLKRQSQQKQNISQSGQQITQQSKLKKRYQQDIRQEKNWKQNNQGQQQQINSLSEVKKSQGKQNQQQNGKYSISKSKAINNKEKSRKKVKNESHTNRTDSSQQQLTHARRNKKDKIDQEERLLQNQEQNSQIITTVHKLKKKSKHQRVKQMEKQSQLRRQKSQLNNKKINNSIQKNKQESKPHTKQQKISKQKKNKSRNDQQHDNSEYQQNNQSISKRQQQQFQCSGQFYRKGESRIRRNKKGQIVKNKSKQAKGQKKDQLQSKDNIKNTKNKLKRNNNKDTDDQNIIDNSQTDLQQQEYQRATNKNQKVQYQKLGKNKPNQKIVSKKNKNRKIVKKVQQQQNQQTEQQQVQSNQQNINNSSDGQLQINENNTQQQATQKITDKKNKNKLNLQNKLSNKKHPVDKAYKGKNKKGDNANQIDGQTNNAQQLNQNNTTKKQQTTKRKTQKNSNKGKIHRQNTKTQKDQNCQQQQYQQLDEQNNLQNTKYPPSKPNNNKNIKVSSKKNGDNIKQQRRKQENQQDEIVDHEEQINENDEQVFINRENQNQQLNVEQNSNQQQQMSHHNKVSHKGVNKIKSNNNKKKLTKQSTIKSKKANNSSTNQANKKNISVDKNSQNQNHNQQLKVYLHNNKIDHSQTQLQRQELSEVQRQELSQEQQFSQQQDQSQSESSEKQSQSQQQQQNQIQQSSQYDQQCDSQQQQDLQEDEQLSSQQQSGKLTNSQDNIQSSQQNELVFKKKSQKDGQIAKKDLKQKNNTKLKHKQTTKNRQNNNANQNLTSNQQQTQTQNQNESHCDQNQSINQNQSSLPKSASEQQHNRQQDQCELKNSKEQKLKINLKQQLQQQKQQNTINIVSQNTQNNIIPFQQSYNQQLGYQESIKQTINKQKQSYTLQQQQTSQKQQSNINQNNLLGLQNNQNANNIRNSTTTSRSNNRILKVYGTSRNNNKSSSDQEDEDEQEQMVQKQQQQNELQQQQANTNLNNDKQPKTAPIYNSNNKQPIQTQQANTQINASSITPKQTTKSQKEKSPKSKFKKNNQPDLQKSQNQNQTFKANSQKQQIDCSEPQLNQSQQQYQVIRAPITRQFYGQSFSSQVQRYPIILSQKSNTKQLTQLQNNSQKQSLPKSILASLPPSFFSNQTVLFNKKSIQVQKLVVNSYPLTNLIKCIKILAEINQFLIVRLFENPHVNKITNKTIFGVWLCINYEWKCITVDLRNVLLSTLKTNQPLFFQHSNKQLWPIVLVTALATALKGYQNLVNVPCYKYFNILTGSNSLFFNIKQDPTKNGKILRYISDCQNKNFVIHAEKVCKNLEELQRKQKQSKIYYVLSQKTVNENQIILQMRESTNPQNSTWVKLSRFVQQFKSIQILQLRLNHNFASLPIIKQMDNLSNQTTTVVELQFLRESFGSITLSTEGCQQTGLIKTYLYKQQKSNVLKLIGQAKQKNKCTLFFDCYFSQSKYYLFVQCNVNCRMTYLGENQPLLRVIEQINGDGLKNDYIEYLPVRNTSSNNNNRYNKQNFQQTFRSKMPHTINKGKFGQTGMSFRSQEDKISRLRQNFVQYLLKGKDGTV